MLKTVNVLEALQGVASGDYLMIDVRRPDEWAKTGRPAGSHGVTLEDPEFVTKVQALASTKPEATLALSCLSGARSMQACEILAEAGISNVANVKGGFAAWEGEELPIERS